MCELQPTKIEYDEAKFTELMVYVATRMANDASFGATKLNKVMFFADFWHYAQYGRPITGAEYQKLINGPAPRRLLPVQDALFQRDEAHQVRVRVGSYQQKRFVPLREPNLAIFTAQEIDFVDHVINILRDSTATRVSQLSHQLAAWQMAGVGGTIPYNAIFIYNGPVTDDDCEHAARVMEQLRLQLEGAGVI
jgi:hypothetical protein